MINQLPPKIAAAIVQHKCTSDISSNIASITADINRCAIDGAELIVLPELHNTLYFCQSEDQTHFDLAETIPGPSTQHFGELAKKLSIVIVISLFEKRGTGLYHNTAVVIEKDGSIAGTYRKMHIPDDPGFYEKFYFAPGDKGFNPIQTSVGKLGLLICWDQWYPESARLMALAGADILIYPTAIGWDPSDSADEKKRQQTAWITIQRAHAIANGIPVISVNRIGFEESPIKDATGIDFWGSSFIAGPQGEILLQASSNKAECHIVSIDTSRAETVRRTWPFFRDRRIDSYQDITRRYID
ncbi:MAG: carbon-nitrogen hydrolase [Spirochaetes bacterium]|jgi:N-carbamoylputrescine amidase|nr:carbon-nitrogen hydrolase [Spirochaetota bacterium]